MNTPIIIIAIFYLMILFKLKYLFQEVMTKNNYLKDSIKSKNMDPAKLCYMNQEDIEPDKYKQILEKEN